MKKLQKFLDLFLPNQYIITDHWAEKNSDPDQPTLYYLGDYYVDLVSYPHLFRELNWWEERDTSEMPKYVKFGNGLVREVASPAPEIPAFGRNYVNIIDVDGEIIDLEMKYLRDFQPATEEEFLASK